MFDQTIYRPTTGKKQGVLFHEPVEVPLPERTGRDAASAKKFDEKATRSLFADQVDPADLAGIPDTKRDSPAYLESARKQWLEKGTDSPFFKKWFGESKVLDEDGKPLVVYHGGRDNFNRFGDWNHWASASADTAQTYADKYETGQAEIKPLYLHIARPLDLRDPMIFEKWIGRPMNPRPITGGPRERLNGNYLGSVIDKAKAAGYDGLIHYDTDQMNRAAGGESYVFFNSRQAKLAPAESESWWDTPLRQGGNRGTFDAGKPDIRFSVPKGDKEGPIKGNPDTKYAVEGKAGEGPRGGDERTGPHGPVLTAYHHNAPAAVAELMRRNTGEAVGALHHPAVGDIDLIWGKAGDKPGSGYGLAKIAARHPEVLPDLQGFIENLNVRERNPNSVILESPDGEAVVRLNWMGKAKRWLLTAYQKNDPSRPGKRIDASGNPDGLTGRQALPSRSGSETDTMPPAPPRVKENPPDTKFSVASADRAGIPDANKDSPAYIESARKQWLEKGTDSPFFKKWFGKSKVVDEKGKPLVVYHGTAFDFNQFGPKQKTVSASVLPDAYFFTDNAKVASDFGVDARDVGDGGRPNVKPIYLKMENPLIVDAKGGSWQEHTVPAVHQARRNGNDGAVIENVRDSSAFGGAASQAESVVLPQVESALRHMDAARLRELRDWLHGQYDLGTSRSLTTPSVASRLLARAHGFDSGAMDGVATAKDISRARGILDGFNLDRNALNIILETRPQRGPHTTYVAFSPEQIKSATGNRGTFDAGNSDIRFSVPKGDKKGQSQTVEIRGDELGQGLDFREMRKRAYRYAKDNFLGKTITTHSDHVEIAIPAKGISKSVSLPRSVEELQATVAIPQMLERSVELRPSQPDREGNPNVKAVHYRDVDVNIGGENRHFIMVVKETRGGNKFYDRYIEQKKAQPVKSEGSSVARSSPDSEAAGPTNTIGRQSGQVKENPPDTKFSVDPADRAGIPDTKRDSPAYLESARKQWLEKGADSPFFKKWFGESKVVDEEGKPLVVYRGGPSSDWRSGQEINMFQSTNGPWAGFFTSRADVAGDFAGATSSEGVVTPAYVAIRHPLEIDAGGRPARTLQIDASAIGGKDHPIRSEFIDGKYDGLIIRNTSDEGDVFIPKSSEQIKSATGNRGTFDAENPDIRFSVPKGDKKGQSQAVEIRGDEIPGFAQARQSVREDGKPDFSAMRRVVRNWAKEQLVGKTIHNQQSGRDVVITSGGIDHGLTNRATPQQMAATYKLAELIREGRVASSTTDNKGRPGIAAVHILESTANVEGRPYLARITVHENNAGDWLYAYRLRKEEGPQGNAAGPLELRPLRPQDNTIDRQGRQVKENPDAKYAVGLSEARGVHRPQAEKEGIGRKIRGMWDQVRIKLEDEFLPVRRAVEEVEKHGGSVTDASDTGMKLDIFHGKVASDFDVVERKTLDGQALIIPPAIVCGHKGAVHSRKAACGRNSRQGLNDKMKSFVSLFSTMIQGA